MSSNPFAHLRFHGHTDVGQKRKNNEDDLGLFPEVGMFCVADGMGGGDDGEVASSSTVAALSAVASKCVPPEGSAYPFEGLIRLVKRSLSDVSYRIYKRTGEMGLKSCGSTFVGVCFDASNPSRAMALHAGDSRLYLIRGGVVHQVTRDHSPAEAVGEKDESQVNPMFKGMILRAVGVNGSVDIEETPFEVASGDKILLCSDGLYRMVDEKKIVAILGSAQSLQSAVTDLVAAANVAGGIDNITVELIEIGDLPKPLATTELPEGIYERIRVALPRFEEHRQRTMSAADETARSSSRSSISRDTFSAARTSSFEDPQFAPETVEEPEEPSLRRLINLFVRREQMWIIAAVVVVVTIVGLAAILLLARQEATEGKLNDEPVNLDEIRAQAIKEERERSKRVYNLEESIRKDCREGNIDVAIERLEAEKVKNYLEQDEKTKFEQLILESRNTIDKGDPTTNKGEKTEGKDAQGRVSKPDQECAGISIDLSRLSEGVKCSFDGDDPIDASKEEEYLEGKEEGDLEESIVKDVEEKERLDASEKEGRESGKDKKPDPEEGPEEGYARVSIDWSRLPEGVKCRFDRDDPIDAVHGEVDLIEGYHAVVWSRVGFKPLKKKLSFRGLSHGKLSLPGPEEWSPDVDSGQDGLE